jgi:hypothetical protein
MPNHRHVLPSQYYCSTSPMQYHVVLEQHVSKYGRVSVPTNFFVTAALMQISWSAIHAAPLDGEHLKHHTKF